MVTLQDRPGRAARQSKCRRLLIERYKTGLDEGLTNFPDFFVCLVLIA